MNSTEEKPLILITNDDGYQAQGIQELATLMATLGEVYVVAPDSARSGAACSITSTSPVSLKDLGVSEGVHWYACSGSPVDCVKLAYEEVCPRCPSLVVSGINHGDNASVSLHYSGTMGAVIEGCAKGISSIGYSLRTWSHHCDFAPYRQEILKIAAHVLQHPLRNNICLNVNFPEVPQLAGTKVCRLAQGTWSSEWADAHNPRGVKSYWLTGHFTNLEPEAEDTDYWALDHGYATITPIELDMTAYAVMDSLKSLES